MTQVRTIDVLRAARKRIAKPERWTRVMLARNRQNAWVDVNDPKACCWCLVGAIWKEIPSSLYGDRTTNLLMDALRTIAKRYGYKYIGDANDFGGHAVAIEILDDAIAELAGGEALK